MLLWFIGFNTYNLAKTLLICLIVLFSSLLLFYLIWLRNTYFNVPSLEHCLEDRFSVTDNFLKKMATCIRHLYFYPYWLRNVGFDSKLTRLLLSSLFTQNHPYTLCLFDGLLVCIDRLLYNREA